MNSIICKPASLLRGSNVAQRTTFATNDNIPHITMSFVATLSFVAKHSCWHLPFFGNDQDILFVSSIVNRYMYIGKKTRVQYERHTQF